jgi:hypothetical protein
MIQLYISVILLLASYPLQQDLTFKTKSGHTIEVRGDIIHFDKKPISGEIVGVMQHSKYSRLIEQNGSILLFLEIDGAPNFNTIKGFTIKNNKATEVCDVVYNDDMHGIGPAPFTDMDGDGKLELGGFDLSEAYDAEDSMYYNPSQYFEIDHGTLRFDSAFTKKMDIKVNGLYLPHPLNANGTCCVVIRKPENKKKKK